MADRPSMVTPSTGILVSGPHAQPVADHDRVERNLLVAAVGADAPGGLGGEVEQRADGARRLLARAQLEHLPQQHQHGDDRSGLEIDGNRAVGAAERGWEKAGKQDRHGAVDPRHPGAHGNEGEHVEIAREEGLPAAHEERPTRPQHHRSREDELQPVRQFRADEHMQVGEMAAHLEDHDRKRKSEPQPEAPGHVDKLGVRRRCRRDQFGLQRHAADRARPRPQLADLRMHWASVDSALRHRLRRRAVGRSEKFGRVVGELGLAPSRAEIVGPPGMLLPMGRLMGIDQHAADGIAHPLGCPAGIALGRMGVMCVALVRRVRQLRAGRGWGCRRVLHGATTSHAICSPGSGRCGGGRTPLGRAPARIQKRACRSIP